MVSAIQNFSKPRWPRRRAWWAMVMVTLELTSKMVLISGRCHGSITSLGGGNSFGSGVCSSGQVNSKVGHNMCATPLAPSPPSHGPASTRT
ncbi:hypothetical protein D3C71_1855650 [compost metagenome]